MIPNHGMLLDWWNTTKSYCNIWHQSLCLCTLWRGLKINLCNKLNYNDGFLREVQDRTKKCGRICWIGFPILQPNPGIFQTTKFEFRKLMKLKIRCPSHLAIVDHQRTYVFLLINAAAWKWMEVITCFIFHLSSCILYFELSWCSCSVCFCIFHSFSRGSIN